MTNYTPVSSGVLQGVTRQFGWSGTIQLRSTKNYCLFDLVFTRYSNSIHSINHIAPSGKSDHAILQVNFAVSNLPAANGIDWESISKMAHDQWYLIKITILLLQHRFLPVGPVSRRRTLTQSETQTCTKKETFGVCPVQEQPIG